MAKTKRTKANKSDQPLEDDFAAENAHANADGRAGAQNIGVVSGHHVVAGGARWNA